MARVWIWAGLVVAATTVCALLVGFVGTTTLVTMSLPIGGGAVAAYLPGGSFLGRGGWLFGGVLLGALGFVIGSVAFPDNAVGLWLGAIVPVILLAALTMWTRKESHFLAGLVGAGSINGVYATSFQLDPQSLNVSLPIAIGQTVFPLGLGFLAGVGALLLTARMSPPSDQEPEALAGPDGGTAPGAAVGMDDRTQVLTGVGPADDSRPGTRS
jgi:hypothetical protein